jgi:hypothetical protein
MRIAISRKRRVTAYELCPYQLPPTKAQGAKKGREHRRYAFAQERTIHAAVDGAEGWYVLVS